MKICVVLVLLFASAVRADDALDKSIKAEIDKLTWVNEIEEDPSLARESELQRRVFNKEYRKYQKEVETIWAEIPRHIKALNTDDYEQGNAAEKRLIEIGLSKDLPKWLTEILRKEIISKLERHIDESEQFRRRATRILARVDFPTKKRLKELVAEISTAVMKKKGDEVKRLSAIIMSYAMKDLRFVARELRKLRDDGEFPNENYGKPKEEWVMIGTLDRLLRDIEYMRDQESYERNRTARTHK